MEIRFQPALLQEVIDSFIEKTEREGDPTYYKEFHEHADPIYEKFMLEDREGEFKKLYQYLFGTWGFSDIIRDSFNEYPLLKERVGIVLVKGVLKEAQEQGYAEADPTFDIEGIDAAHKATIMSAIAFGIPVQFAKAHVEGIASSPQLQEAFHKLVEGFRATKTPVVPPLAQFFEAHDAVTPEIRTGTE